jgi:hypothetical protein
MGNRVIRTALDEGEFVKRAFMRPRLVLLLLFFLMSALCSCTSHRQSIKSRHSGPRSDLANTTFEKYMVTTTTGKTYMGQIVGVSNDRVFILPYPYWNTAALQVRIELIQKVEEVPEEKNIAAPLALYLGAIAGGLGAIIIGAEGLSSGKYDRDFQDSMEMGALGGICLAPCGGLLGYLLGASMESKDGSKYAFLRMSKQEKIRSIERIARVKAGEWDGLAVEVAEADEEQGTAKPLFSTACERGDMRGCYNLGVAYRDGVNVRKDSIKAAALFKTACDRGFAKACYNLGLMYWYGFGVHESKESAISLIRKACAGGIERACSVPTGVAAPGEPPQAPEVPDSPEPVEEEPAPAEPVPEAPACPEGARLVEEGTIEGFLRPAVG